MASLIGLAGTGSAAELSAGGYHMVRVDSGAVKGLGDGTYGQLGTSPSGAPATLAGLTNVTDVAAGGFSTLALKSDGTVWFLGETTLQHTTPHGTPDPVSTPVQVPGLAGIDAIAAGHRHFLALDADTGNLYAWGHNGSGQAGNGGLLDVTSPVVVLTGVASVSAGDGFSLAVKSDRTLWAWGRNSHGQLGLGDTADRLTPTQVPGISTAVAVAGGGQHTLILLAGGTVLATGNNGFGQLGLGTTTPTSTPAAVPGLSGVTAVSAGYFHSAAFSAGQVSVWGRNFEGQCGGGASSPVTQLSPQLLAGLSGTPTGVHCGYHFTLVELSDGSVMGTGSNSDGQIDGSSVADQDNSQKILAPQTTPISPDFSPPSPNPMSFASPPAPASATSITMTATTATDPSGPVEYFFDCTTPGGNDSAWQSDPTYIDTGLTTGVSYTYQVKARDAVGNETSFSDPASAAPEADTTPPGIVALSPANGASGVAVDTTLLLTLGESVQKGAGSLRIKEKLGNEIVATIDITSGSVTIDGGQVTIVLPANLGNATAYYIEIDGGALADLSGNDFAGIAGSATWSFTTAVATAPNAALIAHYTFDVANSGSTPDSVGANSATLGSRVQINTTVANRLGNGALEMLGGGNTQGPGNGAVTSNSFSWASDARTITFWWKAKSPNVNTSNGTFVSFGTEPNNGARFDIKEQTAGMLRVEVQGHGFSSNPPNFDDGNWHFVAVTVPDNAVFADISWFAGVRGATLSGNLNTSTNTLAIATGTGPIAFGDSIVSTITSPTADNDRVPNGYLDDVQIYDELLTPGQIASLYHNPGSVIVNPLDGFAAFVSDPAFGLDPGQQGFIQDPDGDGLANGLEAWFGTHPGEFDPGLSSPSTNGTVTIFTHPQNETRPANIVGFYEWSPNLLDWYAGDGVDGPSGGQTVFIAPVTAGTTTTVTATASHTMKRIFLRAGVTLLPSP
jgi:alpha-tubulin suppressor-like RCC1 family protein